MVIAALISPENIPGSPLWHSLYLLSEKYPDDRFIIFSKHPLTASAGNITVVQNVPRGNALLQQFWYRNDLSRLLKKYKADAFISDTGILGKKLFLPQFLFFNDHSFESRLSFLFQKKLTRSLHEAKAIFSTENFITNILSEKYHADPGKLRTVYHGAAGNDGRNITAEAVKEKFTGGNDYFICPANASSAGHMMSLLKAFSLFKKRQRSSMKLVLLLNNIVEKGLIPDFENYKYRNDVVIVTAGEKTASALIPHAYALIWLNRYSPAKEAFRAIRHQVPVIAADTNINRDLFGNAVLFSAISPESLTEQMQLLYKDETAKNNMAALAHVFIQKYDAAGAAEALYLGLRES